MPGMLDWKIKISADIKDLQNKMHKVEGELGEFEGKDHKVKLDLDTKTLESALKKLDSMLDSLGKGTGDFKQFETLSKDLAKVTSELSGFTKAFGKIDNSGTKSLLDMVQNIDKSLNNLSNHVTDITKNLGNIGKDSGTSSAVTQIENITKANEEAIKSTEKLAEARKKINDNIGTSSKSFSEADAIKQAKDAYKKDATAFADSMSKKEASINGLLDKLTKLNKTVRRDTSEKNLIDYKNYENKDLTKATLNKALQKMPKSGNALKDYMLLTLRGKTGESRDDLLKVMGWLGEDPFEDIGQNVFNDINSKTSKNKALQISQVVREYVEQWKNGDSELQKVKKEIASTVDQLMAELNIPNPSKFGDGSTQSILDRWGSYFTTKDGMPMALSTILEDPIKGLNELVGNKGSRRDTSYLKDFNLIDNQSFSSLDELRNKIISLEGEKKKLYESDNYSIDTKNQIKQIEAEISACQHLLKISEEIYSQKNTPANTSSTSSTISEQNKIQEELKETQVQAEQAKQAVEEVDSQTQKNNTQPNTESEAKAMQEVKLSAEEAIQAKKDFATANESVQSSVDGSKSPLELEAELMERVATSAREAANAKKEFVEANKQVKDSANDTNSENKKRNKYAKRSKISEDDFLNFSPSRVNEKLSNSGYTILGETVNTELVDGLVKVSAKIKDVDGVWKAFSAKVDADGNIFEQRFKTVTNGVDKLENALKNFGRETSPALTYQETLDKAQKIKNGLNLGDEYSIKVDSSEFVTITKKLIDVENAGSSVTQTFKSAQDAIDNFGKSTSNSAEKTSVALKSIKSINANDSKAKDTSQSSVNNALKQQLEAEKEIQSINVRIAKTNQNDTTEIKRLNQIKKGYEDNFNQAKKILEANSSLYDKELQVAKLEQIRVDANKKISDYQDKQISGYDKRLPNYQKKLSGYSATAEKFKDGGWTSSTYLDSMNKLNAAIQEYERLINRAKANPDLFNQDELNAAEESIKNIINSISNMSASQKGFTQLAGEKELDKIDQILKENSAMSKTAKNQIRAYYNEIKSGNPSASLDVIHGKILEIVNSEREAGRSGKRMLDVIKDKAFYGLASQIGMYFGFTDIIRYAGEAVNKIIDVDTALTELRKVSDASDERLAVNFKNSANTAKELGSSITDVISATADWSRMGYDIDQSEELARVSTLYKNVGDGIDIESANESLISTLQGFQLDASDAESIIDKFNEVANNYAIDSAGIGEALQRSAASFNAANTDLSKSIALITATRLHRLVEYMETYIKNIFNCHRSLYYYAPQYRG